MPLHIQVHRIVKEKKERGEYIPLHTHPFFHCVYILGGQGHVQIGSETIMAHQGLFLRIAPGVEHAIFGDNAMQSFDIKFSASGNLLDPLCALPIAMPLDNYEHTLVTSLFHLAVRGGVYAEALINARMTELLILLLRRNVQEMPACILPSSNGCASLYPAVAYIEQHSDETPSVAFLAELCGYHPAYFSTLFKDTFGCSPSRYLRDKKISLAREWLLTTDCTVSQAARDLGMETAAFSRMFKKATGLSPSQYLHRVNSDLGINISPDSPYLPEGPFEVPKRSVSDSVDI